MAALTAGLADIVPRTPRTPRTGPSAGPSADLNPATGTGATNSGPTFHIGNLVLQIPGAFNLGTGTDKRRLIVEIAEGLVKYQTERS